MEARFICQVEGCGKLYLEKKQYEIHLRHHKSYVPSKGRYFKCDHCESKFNTQGNLDVHVIHSHLSNSQVTKHIYLSNFQCMVKISKDKLEGYGRGSLEKDYFRDHHGQPTEHNHILGIAG